LADIKLPVKIGLILLQVEAHGPAANAGLQKYDVITHVNGKSVRTIEQFRAVVESLELGKEYKVTGYRAICKRDPGNNEGFVL
jgi:serine protease Do